MFFYVKLKLVGEIMFSILIVDDRAADREGIRDLIDWDSLGIQVVGMAGDGLEGCELAFEHKPDFILTDVDMPGMDGLKMTERIKRQLPQTKFIFISCFDDFNYIKDAMKLEAYAYVLKPIHLQELADAIEKVKALKQNEMERERTLEEQKQKLKSSMPLLQEQFLRDLLHEKITQEKEVLERLDYLGINHENKKAIVIYIEVDNFELVYKEADPERKYLLAHHVLEYVKAFLFQAGEGYVINQQYSSLVVILFENPSPGKDAYGELTGRLSHCKSSINAHLEVGITMGVSDFVDTPLELPNAFRNAKYAVDSKFYGEGNRIIFVSDIVKPDASSQYDLQVMKSELVLILEGDDRMKTGSFIEKYFGNGTCYSASYIKGLSFTLVNIIQTILLEKNESFKNIFGQELLIWEKLTRFETIVDIKQWLVNVIEGVALYLKNLDSSRYRKIVEDIKSIIEENYVRVNVEDIVKNLYISPSYANHIFRQYTGMTIFDYLIHTRMEVAKKLLLDPYSKVYEVSEKVGYINKSYFTSMFKDHTGLTPKQYMDKYAK